MGGRIKRIYLGSQSGDVIRWGKNGFDQLGSNAMGEFLIGFGDSRNVGGCASRQCRRDGDGGEDWAGTEPVRRGCGEAGPHGDPDGCRGRDGEGSVRRTR